MPYEYSNPKRASDKHAMPDVWVTELTAEEIAQQDEDTLREYMRRHEFRFANMNSRVRDAMIETIVEEQEIKAGWCWAYCLPGCMPDSSFNGPFSSYAEALADMRKQAESEDAGDDDESDAG